MLLNIHHMYSDAVQHINNFISIYSKYSDRRVSSFCLCSREKKKVRFHQPRISFRSIAVLNSTHTHAQHHIVLRHQLRWPPSSPLPRSFHSLSNAVLPTDSVCSTPKRIYTIENVSDRAAAQCNLDV